MVRVQDGGRGESRWMYENRMAYRVDQNISERKVVASFECGIQLRNTTVSDMFVDRCARSY